MTDPVTTETDLVDAVGAAISARNLAVTAKNDAVDAKVETEALVEITRGLRNNASDAAASAATALSGAAASASAASSSASAAATSASAAAASKTAADANVAATAADRTATHADKLSADADAATAATQANNASTSASAAAASASAAAASAAILTYRGFVNRLRNADLRINQRGVSGTVTLAAGAYGHDGVKAGAGGATYTFAQSGIDVTITISAGSIILPIETNLIEGGVYRLSHQGTAQARVWQGTGYTGSGSYAAAPFTTASLAANTQTNVEFSSGTIIRPQLEPGSTETAFERRPFAFELAFCQRYYYRRTANNTTDIIAMMSAYNASTVWGKLFDLPVEMRLDGGTVGVSAASHLSVWNAVGSASYAGSSVSGAQASKRSVGFWEGLSVSGSFGFTAGQALFLIFNNASGWIDVSTEI